MYNLQQKAQESIDELVEAGAERGLQVAVYRHGELLVDAVAGIADPATERPVTSDTPFFSYSIGKGVVATALHVLAERGLVSYGTRIVELWPAFGAHGKERVTVRHVLSQSAGVPGLPTDITVADLTDWDKMCAIVADETPWWEPGTAIGYHAVTFGYLVGEIVRRVAGKPISDVLRDDVAGPLGVAGELYFAVPASERDRLARLEDAEGGESMFGELPERTRPCSGSGRRRRRPPRTAIATTCSPPTSPPGAPSPLGRWRACTPRCWVRWTASA